MCSTLPDVDETYLNALRPSGSSTAVAGRASVLARFVLLDGSEEWRPAMAVRWSDGSVLVASHSGPPEYTWLSRDDVAPAGRPAPLHRGHLR
jgi:hypothetical protein